MAYEYERDEWRAAQRDLSEREHAQPVPEAGEVLKLDVEEWIKAVRTISTYP